MQKQKTKAKRSTRNQGKTLERLAIDSLCKFTEAFVDSDALHIWRMFLETTLLAIEQEHGCGIETRRTGRVIKRRK